VDAHRRLVEEVLDVEAVGVDGPGLDVLHLDPLRAGDLALDWVAGEKERIVLGGDPPDERVDVAGRRPPNLPLVGAVADVPEFDLVVIGEFVEFPEFRQPVPAGLPAVVGLGL